ncbi:MAG: very short patch repair endonuclease [Acidobacteriia bacterium]|nr:very short patch repair endonuclease [Terriglobia bacterium]
MMKAVKQTNTGAELKVRKLMTALGTRYRLGNGDLPGSPDLANRTKRWAVFVNGCFWHGHKNCPKTKGGAGSRIPKVRHHFWRNKLEDNRRRDAHKCRALRRLGFRVVIVWECQLRNVAQLRGRLARLLFSHAGQKQGS